MKQEFLTCDIPKLYPFLETIIHDGGKKHYAIEGDVVVSKFIEGRSGFIIREGSLEAIIEIGILFAGVGFVVRRYFKNDEEQFERFDHFDPNGNFTFTSFFKELELLYVDTIEIEKNCPILNHLYNFLSDEYSKATEGKSWMTSQVYEVEMFLRRLYQSKTIKLSIQGQANDPAINQIYQKMLQIEMDPVLTWEERQIVFQSYRKTMDKIVSTKIRAHKLSGPLFRMKLFKKDLSHFLERLLARPVNNIQGLIHRYTIGKLIWFFSTVKNNLGYSIALAVYGPFTYYFITMPMNPHAMQAVGKVRSTYIDIKSELGEFIDRTANLGQLSAQTKTQNQDPVPLPSAEHQPNSAALIEDQVSTQNAAPLTQSQQANSNIIYQSEVALGPAQELMVDLGKGEKIKLKPTFLNMLLSTDVPQVDRQSWNDRMGHFKQMQMAYEENIEYASRMGRLEQLETQYNFPMQIENTWEELERYNNMIFRFRSENPNISPKMKQYLANEVSRTQQLELYLWDRMSRFILDQIYVMLDQDNEQERNDYYVGRSFVFMQEMTNILSWRYKDFKRPQGFERIEKLAKFYAKERKEYGSVLKNLTENSRLYKQKNLLDTKEFRSYIKRQWEILFLQNSKAEEGSNNGLNMYIWSVRNTAWVLQSIYSAKREELALLLKRETTGQILSNEDLFTRSKISLLYETLIHNLTLEYVSIREEMMNRLGKDIESTQRMMVLNNLKEFLTDREKLDGTHVAATQKTAGATL